MNVRRMICLMSFVIAGSLAVTPSAMADGSPPCDQNVGGLVAYGAATYPQPYNGACAHVIVPVPGGGAFGGAGAGFADGASAKEGYGYAGACAQTFCVVAGGGADQGFSGQISGDVFVCYVDVFQEVCLP